MKERLENFAARLRAPGVLAVGVLLGCAAFYLSALAPGEEQLARLRASDARLGAAGGTAATASGQPADLRRFYGHFPAADALADEIERVHRLARGSGLELAQGEYRLEPRGAGLRAYRISLPLRGSYAQIRGFVAAVLKEMPAVSVDALRFERKQASETQLDAQLRFTLFLRPAGEPS